MQFPSNRVDNGYVSSGFLAFPLTNRLPVNGSFYNDLLHSFKTQIEKNGDWLWLKDYCTGDTFMASEFEPLSKKSVYLSLALVAISRPGFFVRTIFVQNGKWSLFLEPTPTPRQMP